METQNHCHGSSAHQRVAKHCTETAPKWDHATDRTGTYRPQKVVSTVKTCKKETGTQYVDV